MKTCPKCGSDGPFGKCKSREDGLTRMCKGCSNAASRVWYGKHLDKARAKAREYQKAHPTETKARNAAYFEKHRERLRADARAYHMAHRDQRNANRRAHYRAHIDERREADRQYHLEHRNSRLAYSRAYYQANREKHYEQNRAWHEHNHQRSKQLRQRAGANRRCSVRGAVNTLTATEWALICDTFWHRCAYCWDKPSTLTIDHVIPLSKGGANSWRNVVPACKSCNARKCDSTEYAHLGSKA